MDNNHITHTTMRAGTLSLAVWPDTPLGEHQRYAYRIKDTATGQVVEGRDLFTGTGAPVEPDQAIRSLAGFLNAAGEARQHTLDHPGTDSGGMFPDWIADAVLDNTDAVVELSQWSGPADPLAQSGPVEGSTRRWLDVVFFDGDQDQTVTDVFKIIDTEGIAAAIEYVKQWDFGHDDLTEPRMAAYLHDSIPLSASEQVATVGGYALVFDRKNEHIRVLRQVTTGQVTTEREQEHPQRWINIVFLQGAEADDILAVIDRYGTDIAIGYLTGYDYGEESVQAALENGYVYDVLPTGTVDEVATNGTYTLSYNHHLGHVSLFRDYNPPTGPSLSGTRSLTVPEHAKEVRHRPSNPAVGDDWFGESPRPGQPGPGLSGQGFSL